MISQHCSMAKSFYNIMGTLHDIVLSCTWIINYNFIVSEQCLAQDATMASGIIIAHIITGIICMSLTSRNEDCTHG